LDFF
jgi:Ethylene-responsive protein kinase Le-CTR1